MVIFHSFLYVYQRLGGILGGSRNLGNFPDANSSDDIPVDLAEALDAFWFLDSDLRADQENSSLLN